MPGSELHFPEGPAARYRLPLQPGPTLLEPVQLLGKVLQVWRGTQLKCIGVAFFGSRAL